MPQMQQMQMPLHSEPPQMVARQESSVDVEMDTEEIRKLEQEFAKKMQRAKKSYGTRMDNLHRSKEEAEAQHQMTLEKHEKERVEYEKKVRLAEEEQTRRLNQIQKEYIEKKKETARQQRAKQPSTGVEGMQMQNGNVGESCSAVSGGSRPPLHGGHKRSSSHFDATMSTPGMQPSQSHQQASPMMTDHKRNSSESDLSKDSSQALLDQQSHPQQQQIQQPPRSLPPNLPKPQRQTSAGGTTASARDRSGSTSS